MKLLSRLSKISVEYYLVIFLLIVVVMMANSSVGEPAPYQVFSSLTQTPFEGFKSSFPEKVHSAAHVRGNEVDALQGNKGVLGIFEAEGLKAAPTNAPGLHDPLSKLTASPDCLGQSVYTTSKGGICITDEMRKTFNTRGGNSC